MPNLIVRQATIFDLRVLVPLFDGYRVFYERASDVAAAHAFLLDRFKHAESVIFLAQLGAQSVGFAQLYPSFSSASMARIFILTLSTAATNARAQAVYESLGWKRDRQFYVYNLSL